MLLDLKEVISKEKLAVEKQLAFLDKQNRLIMKNNAIELEVVAEEIQSVSREIAECEMEKRKILKDRNLKELVFESDDKELEQLFRETKKKVELLKLQNDTNALLIKQQLSYTNKMLMILNPNRDAKTYNSYGKIKR